MFVLTECPSCGARRPIEAEKVGREAACDRCGRAFAATDVGVPEGVRPHRAGLILGLGTAALVVFGVFGPPAWLLGRRDLRRMAVGEMDPAGLKNTRLGVTLGKIGTAKFAVEILLIIGIVAAILAYAYYLAEKGG